jgi:hypothetical protein
MLAARFEQAGGIEVLEIGDEASATTDAAAAVGAARAQSAEFVVFGSFTQFGDGASLDVRCARAAGADAEGDPEARQVFIQSGKLGDIIPRLDDLSRRIVHYVKGGELPVPAAGAEAAAAEAPEVSDLERRIEALERAVFFGKSAEGGETAAGAE